MNGNAQITISKHILSNLSTYNEINFTDSNSLRHGNCLGKRIV